jgi:hypothetical protein
MEHYRNTQTGYVIVYSLIAATIMVILIAATQGAPFPFWLLPLVLGVALFLFATMTVTVTERLIQIVFGSGLIKKSVLLIDIESAAPARTKMWHGWGIHWIAPNMWVYNVSGFKAVELRMKRGGRILVGTNQPEELCNALWSAGVANKGKD